MPWVTIEAYRLEAVDAADGDAPTAKVLPIMPEAHKLEANGPPRW